MAGPTLSSDIFSLGLIAFELLGGRLLSWPFEWPPPGYKRFLSRVPQPLVSVLRKACEFEPHQRYVDAIAFRRALEKAESAVRPQRARKRRRAPAASPSPLLVQAELFRRLHGRSLRMRYRCHQCDCAIAEEMPFCPWCGSGENSFAEITPAGLICPWCERGVQAEWTACPWCFAGRFEGNGRRPRRDPRAARSCSRRGCTGQLRPFMRYCPICKQRPGPPVEPPGAFRPLSAVSLAGPSRVLALLRLVRAPRAWARWLPKGQSRVEYGHEQGPELAQQADHRGERTERRTAPCCERWASKTETLPSRSSVWPAGRAISRPVTRGLVSSRQRELRPSGPREECLRPSARSR